MTRAVCFDVWGPYAHFRKPYAPASPVTFPIPPPTAVLGLLGAICGYSKERYHEELGWEKIRIGVAVSAPVRLYRAGLNLLNTKDGTDQFFRPKKDTHHMQIPYEFMADPRFRIFVAETPESVLDTLSKRLAQADPKYTPTLGLANCLASLEMVSDGEAEELGEGSREIATAIPIGEGVKVEYTTERPVQRFRVPAEMDGGRKVHRYQEIAVATDGLPLTASGVPTYRLGDDVFCFI